jgi:hypothetical protein
LICRRLQNQRGRGGEVEPRGDGAVRWFLTGLFAGVGLGLWLAIIVHNLLVID